MSKLPTNMQLVPMNRERDHGIDLFGDLVPESKKRFKMINSTLFEKAWLEACIDPTLPPGMIRFGGHLVHFGVDLSRDYLNEVKAALCGPMGRLMP